MQIDSPSILAESFEGNVDQYGMLPIYETFRTLLYASASCCSTYNWTAAAAGGTTLQANVRALSMEVGFVMSVRGD